MANSEIMIKRMKDNFVLITNDPDIKLFVADCDKDTLWNLYLDSFPEGTNPIYRVRREYDCSCCRSFIKTIGSVVYIDDDYEIHSIFDFNVDDDTFQPVMDALDHYVKSCPIKSQFFSKEDHAGYRLSHELNKETGTVIEYKHLYLDIPSKFVFKKTFDVKTLETAIGNSVANHDVFKRSLEEISLDAIETVLELIDSNTLYKGSEWEGVLLGFKIFKEKYDVLPEEKKDVFCWKHSAAAGPVHTRIKNHSIGVLLTNITDGMNLDEAVRKYEAIVAPSNYKRPKPIFTKKMLEQAENAVRELGYYDSLERRFATLDDIRINNIFFSNKDAGRRMSGGSIFDEMKESVDIVDPRKFSKVDSIGIDKFISDVLPHANEVEVLFENRLSKNLVSLIAPVNPESKSMFKWNNSFSWAYTGNITDSDIRENVKKAGGKVDGFMRFSIQWNDEGNNNWDQNDLDAHCIERLRHIWGYGDGDHIMFNHLKSYSTEGELDVDIIHPNQGTPAVENIVYVDKRNVRTGEYEFFVHCYSNRGGTSGFRAELEVNGDIYNFDYRQPIRNNEVIKVATVTANTANDTYEVKTHIDNNRSSKEIWGIKTNKFIPVTVIMNSPNYWDNQIGIGNKHYMFMLKGCVNPEKPNGFYNEFLRNELNPNRKVFEALGSRMAVRDTSDQLSGLGFSSTKRNELTVKVRGSIERVLKVIF